MPLPALPLSGSGKHLASRLDLTSTVRLLPLIIVMRPEPVGLSRDPRGAGVFPGRASNLGTPSCGSPMVNKMGP